MARADGVAAEAFQYEQLAAQGSTVDGRTQGAEVMVVAGALNGHVLAVEQEAFVV